MLKQIYTVLTAFALTVASYAVAVELAPNHPQTYVVKRGDTLWDIAGRFLKKPWLWPEIWQANPQIQNPHRIYPGDVISLAYLDGRPVATATGPAIKTEDAISTIPLSEIEPFLKQLSVVDDVKSLPYVIGLEEDRLRSSAGQLVYVRGLTGANSGDTFSIVRPTSKYMLPAKGRRLKTTQDELDFDGDRFHTNLNPWRSIGKGKDPLGVEVQLQSIAQVTRTSDDVTTLVLVDENRDIRVGDRIMPLEPNPYDAQFLPKPPASIPEHAAVLAVTDQAMFAGARSVIALSVGSADGITNGDVFSIWHDGKRADDNVKHSSKFVAKRNAANLPDEYAAHVMVFRTFNRVSYGLIMQGIRPVSIGDLLKDPDAAD